MKSLVAFYKYTFSYKVPAILTIIYNLLYVIFNLLSLVLFIPFLQLIFKVNDAVSLVKPNYSGGFINFFTYCKDWYNYTMNEMVKENPKDALLFVCISVVSAFFLKNVFRYGAVWHQSQLRMAVVRDLRDQLFAKAMRLPLSFYTEQRKGDLMARINSDVREIELAVIAILELVFREPFAILVSIASLIYISPQLTLISFVLLPISAFVISRIGKSLKKTAKAGQEQTSLVFSILEESISGIKVIKAFNAIPFITKRFKGVNLRLQQLNTGTFRRGDLSPILNEFLGATVMICLVWFGGIMILDDSDGMLGGAEFITFIIVFSQLLRPIQGIATAVGNLNKAEPSLDRINEILNTEEVILEQENAKDLNTLKSEISVENVSFKYKDEFVLKNIHFKLQRGKSIALVGESGSGKSTIADLLPRFYDVTEGSIFIDGINLKEFKLEDLHKNIGIVSQESILFNDTVRNNIAFGREDVTMESIIQAAKIAHAHSFIEQLENGYDTVIGERGNKLSGGQKQRLSIARAVLKDPSILILDEATSALDTESERIVQGALDELMKDRTSLIIAHRMSTIINADEILVLSKGQIIERGKHQELIALGGTYANLCGLQGIFQ
ncbi:ABC transporter ATP-binding protein [Fluviicola taffensis]|uniref:Xenobiotic-transporting ATPase n=1 Tax=Fluviicola taffensis (strain DSM 16823 / NCIMB 13979 / RW262) TaxID=755732 RepID=F2IKA5_FLUTR|nr:ABC transporter ATP-binding protein [Fluviicola taffensis]AEA44008.1 Xenobiotic-transporting ATPase [Fluviicola taffensis DSM 16823]